MSTESSREFLALQEVVAGRYSLERELGRGGMGIVFLAKDVALDRPVAIKLLPFHQALSRDFRERFMREARTAARLSHPNIVPIHAVEQHGDLVFFVMAYVDGETLGEKVARDGALSIPDGIKILQDVCWALSLAHGRGVVHRDIKPDNILIDARSGRAMVTDFGIARLTGADEITSPGHTVGTPAFMSPEQTQNRDVDGRADLYSLGLTGFFALTGRLPFVADNAAAMVAKHIHEPAPPFATVRRDAPRDLGQVIDRCLAKAPEHRPSTADEVADQLAASAARNPSLPVALTDFAAEIERTVATVGGWVVLAAVAALADVRFRSLASAEIPAEFQAVDSLFRAVSILAMLGMSLQIWKVRNRVHELSAQGFSPKGIQNAVSSTPWRRERPFVLGGAALGIIGFIALYVALPDLTSSRSTNVPVTLRYVFFGIALIVPFILGKRVVTEVVHIGLRERGWWRRFWRHGVMTKLLRIVGGEQRTTSAEPDSQVTELFLGNAVGSVLGELKLSERMQLGDLPEVVNRLESAAQILRDREADLLDALTAAQRHPSSRLAGGDEDELSARKKAALADLAREHEETARRRHEVISALEVLRIGLLRIKGSVATPSDLTADVEAAAGLANAFEEPVEDKD